MAEEGAVAGEEDIPLHTDLGQGMETPAGCLTSDAIPGTEAFQAADVESNPNFEVQRADANTQQANAANRVGLVMNHGLPSWATGAAILPGWVLPDMPQDCHRTLWGRHPAPTGRTTAAWPRQPLATPECQPLVT